MTCRQDRLAEAVAVMAERITTLEDTLEQGSRIVQALVMALQHALAENEHLRDDNAGLRMDIDLVTEREREGRELA